MSTEHCNRQACALRLCLIDAKYSLAYDALRWIWSELAVIVFFVGLAAGGWAKCMKPRTRNWAAMLP